MKKYQLIANTIKERIIKGIYPQQSFLPKQEELAEEFSVSKITVKSALDLLEQEGFVYKESGLGTKVLSNLTLLGQHDSPVNSFAGPVQKDLGRVDLFLPAQEAAYQVWRGLPPDQG